MQKTLIFTTVLAFTLLCCTQDEIQPLPQKSEIIWSDSVPPIIIPDPELGEGNCETDRDWKLRDLIEDFQGFCSSPITQVGNPQWKPGTSEQTKLRYRDTYYMILRDYDYCREHYGK